MFFIFAVTFARSSVFVGRDQEGEILKFYLTALGYLELKTKTKMNTNKQNPNKKTNQQIHPNSKQSRSLSEAFVFFP